MVNFFIIMFHFVYFSQFWYVEGFVQSAWNGWEFKLFVALAVGAYFETVGFWARKLFEDFII